MSLFFGGGGESYYGSLMAVVKRTMDAAKDIMLKEIAAKDIMTKDIMLKDYVERYYGERYYG